MSEAGLRKVRAAIDRKQDFQRIDTYYLRRKRGDVRLRQILLLAMTLGKDSPFLSGTRRWLEQAGIDPSSDHDLRRAWDGLCRRYDADLVR